MGNRYCSYNNYAPMKGKDGERYDEYVDGDNPIWAAKDYCGNTDVYPEPPVGFHSQRCYWKGPAFNTSKGLFKGSELPQMLAQRAKSSVKPDWKENEGWTEAVLDLRSMKSLLETDPGGVIMAFMYVVSAKHIETKSARADALTMQSIFKTDHSIEIPVIGVDITVDTTKSDPFVPDEETIEVSV